MLRQVERKALAKITGSEAFLPPRKISSSTSCQFTCRRTVWTCHREARGRLGTGRAGEPFAHAPFDINQEVALRGRFESDSPRCATANPQPKTEELNLFSQSSRTLVSVPGQAASCTAPPRPDGTFVLLRGLMTRAVLRVRWTFLL